MEILKMVKKMVMVYLNGTFKFIINKGQMEIFMMEIGLRIKFMEKENLYGQMYYFKKIKIYQGR